MMKLYLRLRLDILGKCESISGYPFSLVCDNPEYEGKGYGTITLLMLKKHFLRDTLKGSWQL